jgi:hypothetical protein
MNRIATKQSNMDPFKKKSNMDTILKTNELQAAQIKIYDHTTTNKTIDPNTPNLAISASRVESLH